MKTGIAIFLQQRYSLAWPAALWLGLCLLHFPAALWAVEPIKIGFPMVLSGVSAQFGQPMLKGAQMYVDEINAAGGVLGRPVQLRVRDSQAKPEVAAQMARELVSVEQVDFLVGTFTSGEGPAVSLVAKELKTVFLALGPKTDRLTAPASLHPYVFRMSANTTTESRTAAAIVARWKVKRLAIIAPDFAYGRDAVAVFVAQIKKIRPDITIVDQQWPKLGETNYIPFIEAQLKSQPDVVFSAICCNYFSLFASQAKPLGYFERLNGKFIGIAETGSIEYTRVMKNDYPLGIWGNTYDALNYVPREEMAAKALADFHNKLKRYMNDEYPPSWAIQGYLGMHFLLAGIKKAHSTEALKVAAALRGLELMTPFGPMQIRAKDQQLTRGEVWGKSSLSSKYPFPVLSPVEYIDPKILMD
jgi:branched-chain amino acid transport system substrate-binding protein